MSGGYSGKFLQRHAMQNSTFQYRGNFLARRAKVRALFRLSKSLKSKIFTTMVPPPSPCPQKIYTVFITNLLFRATWRLERAYIPPCSLFLTYLPFFVTPNLFPTLRYFLSSGALDTGCTNLLFCIAICIACSYSQVFSSRLTVTFTLCQRYPWVYIHNSQLLLLC